MSDYNPEKEQRHMLTRDKDGERLVDTINPNLYKVGVLAMKHGITLPNDYAALREIRNARREAEKAQREQADFEREHQRQTEIKARNAAVLAVIAIEEKVALNELRQMVKDIERQQLDKRIERIEAKASDITATHQEPLISLAFDSAYVYEPKAGKLVEKRRTA